MTPYASTYPAPPSPDLGPPEIAYSPTRHIVIAVHPWVDDDHQIVMDGLDSAIDMLTAIKNQHSR